MPEPSRSSRSCARVAVWRQLQRTHYTLARSLERQLAAVGVTPPQALTLALIAERPGAMTPTRLAQELGQDTRGITGLLDRLERRGWVRRVPDPSDRRSFQLHLSDAGRATLERALPLGMASVDEALADLGAEDLAALRTLLARIEERVA